MDTMNRKPAGSSNPIAAKICLTGVFILLVIIIFIPFIAGIKVDAAQRLAQRYLWQDAQQKFQIAMRIDPFDASIPAGFADFLKNISPGRLDENSLLINSAKLYKQALEMDHFNADYASKLAEVEVGLFIRGKSQDSNLLADALDYFKLALKNDPNGFNVSYEIGYNGLEAWPYLDSEFKRLVVGDGDVPTGVFFHHQTVEALVEAIKTLSKIKFDPYAIRRHAEKFDRKEFKRQIAEYITEQLPVSIFK